MPVMLTPYLAVADARAAVEWYGRTLGALLQGELVVMPDGRVGHATLDINGASLFLSDAHPEIGVVAPRAGEGNHVTIHADVADVDALVERAVAAGASLDRPPQDTPHGRVAVIRDPFGHRWMLSSR